MKPEETQLLYTIAQQIKDVATSADKNEANNERSHTKIVSTLEKLGDDLHKRVDEQIEKYPDRITECNKTFLRNKVFYWVMGIMVGIVLAYGGMITTNKMDILRLEVKQEIVQHEADEHEAVHLNANK